MAWTNYHSHTKYDDGTEELEAYVQEALRQGMVAYGFSGHSPVPFKSVWSMSYDATVDYLEDARRLQEKYQGQIQLYVGLEVDFIPGKVSQNDYFISNLGLDYTIGSIHFVENFADGRPWEIDGPHLKFEKGLQQIFEGNVKAVVTRYFELTRQMLNEATPDVLGHMDKIKMHNSYKPFFSEEEAWYRKEVMQTLELVRDKKVILEVNTRGIYKKYTDEFYPGKWVLEEAFKMGIPVMINSDSHHPREMINNFEDAAKTLLDIGYNTVQILYDNRWQAKPLTPQGIEL